MNNYYYDLHIHSCLSPCADNDMSPANIAGMGAVNGLQIMALTDHNTCGNCPAFFKACKPHGIIPIPGMELTTAEDIHMVCLFPDLDTAMAFDAEIKPRILPIKNRSDIFGHQYFMDEKDEIIGEEEKLLISATDLDIGSAIRLVEKMGGVCYPAHIDRPSNGIITTLGDLPADYGFTCIEFNNPANETDYRERYAATSGTVSVFSSDAHHLWDINEAGSVLMIEDEPYSSARVRENLLFNIIKIK